MRKVVQRDHTSEPITRVQLKGGFAVRKQAARRFPCSKALLRSEAAALAHGAWRVCLFLCLPLVRHQISCLLRKKFRTHCGWGAVSHGADKLRADNLASHFITCPNARLSMAMQ